MTPTDQKAQPTPAGVCSDVPTCGPACASVAYFAPFALLLFQVALWRLWDAFMIETATMIGWWEDIEAGQFTAAKHHDNRMGRWSCLRSSSRVPVPHHTSTEGPRGVCVAAE